MVKIDVNPTSIFYKELAEVNVSGLDSITLQYIKNNLKKSNLHPQVLVNWKINLKIMNVLEMFL